MIYRQSLSPELRSPNILWDNVFAKGTVTASSETVAGPGINAVAQATNNAWVCSVSSATLTVVLATAATCNAVGIAAHDLSGKTIAVEYWDGGAWVSAASEVPSDNQSFMIAFDVATALEWRLNVSGGPFRIAVAFLGQTLVVPGTIQPPHTPLHLCEDVELLSGVQSRSGQFLGQDVAIFGGKANLQFEVQYPEFAMNGFDAFRQYFNRGNAFFIACAPRAWPADMGYCWRDGDVIVPPWRDAVFMSLSMGVSVYRG